jgi:hypothetical protein
MSCPARLCCVLVLLGAALPARAQPPEPAPAPPPYGRGRGGEIVLTSSGFGLGAFAMEPVARRTSFLLETSFGIVKDERETKYFGLTGSAILNKRTVLYALPVRAGLSQRLFARHIEPNVRPFVQASVGPTVGWTYPYFDDCNGNGIRERGVDLDGDGDIDEGYDCDGDGVAAESERALGFFEAQQQARILVGAGGLVGAGAHLGYGRRLLGLRLAYRWDYYPTGVALLEADIAARRRLFNTVQVSFTFGQLVD